jgi:hypothetical protein
MDGKANGESTWGADPWEDKTSPEKMKKLSRDAGLFSYMD